jgi:antitoxin CcdA
MGKQRTNITIDAELLAYAREAGLNVSAITEEALRAARREAWAKENAVALAERRGWYDTHDTLLADHRILKV